ncbi:MAG: DUF1570 domain-containing protein [Planctomycetia bacterium]|nr:DUF1570 domain-containing protein [Planctomycetia bacterium]
MRFAILATILVLATVPRAEAAGLGAKGSLFTLELDGRRAEGTALEWSQSEVVFLERDGRLMTFHPGEAKNYRKLGDRFRGYSSSELRAVLTRDLGKDFEISSTGHYLVAHPPGQSAQWSQRFEDLYRSCAHYFSVRGFRLAEPQFPLVAVVYRNQDEFLRQARAEGANIDASVLGYYSPMTNRISMFDIGGGKSNRQDWKMNAETIIHEATHQTAYNTGIHRRFGAAPRWVVEGLGTLFEAPGVYDSRSNSSQPSRVNRGRFDDFRSLVASRQPGTIAELVTNDRLFQSEASRAYAEAWALTYWLVETRPQQYSKYLQSMAARPIFADYTPEQRLEDFTKVFGSNFKLIEAQFLQYMTTVR